MAKAKRQIRFDDGPLCGMVVACNPDHVRKMWAKSEIRQIVSSGGVDLIQSVGIGPCTGEGVFMHFATLLEDGAVQIQFVNYQRDGYPGIGPFCFTPWASGHEMVLTLEADKLDRLPKLDEWVSYDVNDIGFG